MGQIRVDHVLPSRDGKLFRATYGNDFPLMIDSSFMITSLMVI